MPTEPRNAKERRSRPAPATLSATAASGDRPATLRKLRDTLAATIEAAEPQHVASLAKQLAAVMAELEALPAGEVSASDDLARRRADRLSTAASRASSGGGAVKQRSGSGRTR